MNSKLLFRNTLEIRNTSRLAFIPLVYSLAAKISQTPLRDVVHDPTYFANALEAAHKLFKYDGIINAFDSTIEAEACGCELEWGGDYDLPTVTKKSSLNEQLPDDLARSERVSVLLEVTKRLGMSAGRDVAIIGVMTGLFSLAENLVDSFEGRLERQEQDPKVQETLSLLGNLLTKFTRRLCELRVDAVFIREESMGASFLKKVMLFPEAYTTLFNIIKYYDSYPVLILRDFELDGVQNLCDLFRPGGIILSGRRLNEDDLAYLERLSDSLRVCFGLALPVGDQNKLWEQLDLVNDFVIKSKARGFFYTSDGEIPSNIPMEIIHNVMDKISTGF